MTKPRQAAEHERMEYRTLDGNWTVQKPAGYCGYHKRYITQKQARLHRCMAKHGGICGRYQDMKGVYVRKMTQEKYYDRHLDQMKKIETALNKISKSLENVSDFIDMMVDIHREESINKAGHGNSTAMVDDGK